MAEFPAHYQPGQNINHPPGAEAPGQVDGQAFASELIDDGQAFQLLPVGVSIKQKSHRPIPSWLVSVVAAERRLYAFEALSAFAVRMASPLFFGENDPDVLDLPKHGSQGQQGPNDRHLWLVLMGR